MAEKINEPTVEFDAPEVEDVAIASRRLQEYSKRALQLAVEVDRIHVNHDRFAKGLGALDRLFQIGPEFEMTHGMRLVGPPGSGKSALFRYFRDSLPRSNLFAPGYGAVGIRAGRRPTAGQMVGAFLRAYRYPFKNGGSSTVYARTGIVFDLVREKGTRLIFVDEAHNLMRQLKRRDQIDDEPEATDLLRELIDTTKVSLVMAGTDLLDRLHSVDYHLNDRVTVRHALGHFDAGAKWRGFLRAMYKKAQSFDLAVIDSKEEADRLHAATAGNPRSLKRLVTEGVLVAADGGKAALDTESLAKAFQIVFGSDTLMRNPYVG